MTPPARHVAAIWPRVAVVVLLCAAAVALLVSDALRAPLLRLLAVTQTLIAANPLLGALLFVGFAAHFDCRSPGPARSSSAARQPFSCNRDSSLGRPS